jgi:hypothetical protein
MTSIAVEITTDASPKMVWDAIRDIGALHTRLVPGFVLNTELISEGRRVTFVCTPRQGVSYDSQTISHSRKSRSVHEDRYQRH